MELNNMINISKSIKKRINMKKEELEKQLENQLERYEHAVDLPYFNEETGEKMAFVRDGIVEVAEYLKAPIKILWILKEANSKKENDLGNDMRPCLKTLNEKNNNIDPKWGYTWRPIAYAMYGVFEEMNYIDIPLMNGNASEVVKHMSRIAHINVKKYGGGSKSNDKQIQNFYNQYKDFIHEQIEIINPNVLIFGGTFGYFADVYFEGKKPLSEKPNGYTNIYEYQDKLLIDTYHPGARVNKQEYCDGVINAIKKWNKKMKIN